MATTLTYGATTVTLPEDIIWVDEFDWQAVEGRMSYSIAGAVLFDRGTKVDGRPMTMAGGPDHAWILRSLAETLFAWSLVAGAAFTLSFRGASFAVVFDHSKMPIELWPIVDYPEYVAGDFYTLLLRLIQKA